MATTPRVTANEKEIMMDLSNFKNRNFINLLKSAETLSQPNSITLSYTTVAPSGAKPSPEALSPLAFGTVLQPLSEVRTDQARNRTTKD